MVTLYLIDIHRRTWSYLFIFVNKFLRHKSRHCSMQETRHCESVRAAGPTSPTIWTSNDHPPKVINHSLICYQCSLYAITTDISNGRCFQHRSTPELQRWRQKPEVLVSRIPRLARTKLKRFLWGIWGRLCKVEQLDADTSRHRPTLEMDMAAIPTQKLSVYYLREQMWA